MEQAEYRVYSYRWVVLAAFMLVTVVNQLLWITFASITGEAAGVYGVSDLSIGLLSMVFMIVYLVVWFPASWAIDTYGIRVAVGIGAGLTGVFGLLRGLFAADYTLVLVSQVGIAIGQPFILNSITKVAARWFPVEERATAAGLGSLAMYVGILLGVALTPVLTLRLLGFSATLLAYGIAALVAAAVFFAVARERPATPPCPPDQEERTLVFAGLRQTLRNRNFILLMIIFFFGLGTFNSVTTWIEDIVRPRGFSSVEAGLAGGLMIVGGILGALIMPAISDRYRKRVPFIVGTLVGMIPGLVGITFATGYGLLLASAFIMGFFLLAAGPIGFQYGAETAYPAPEGMSNGLLLFMGQISGIIFIFAMDGLKSAETGSMSSSLVIMIALMAASVALATKLRESTLVTGSGS